MNLPQRAAGMGPWDPIGTWRGPNRQKLNSQAGGVGLCRATMQPWMAIGPFTDERPSNGENRQARDGIVGSDNFVWISQRSWTTGLTTGSSTYIPTYLVGSQHTCKVPTGLRGSRAPRAERVPNVTSPGLSTWAILVLQRRIS